MFPCGDHMVCIIDDREDVWNFAPNLITVKPYKFFKGSDDINDPFQTPVNSEICEKEITNNDNREKDFCNEKTKLNSNLLDNISTEDLPVCGSSEKVDSDKKISSIESLNENALEKG